MGKGGKGKRKAQAGKKPTNNKQGRPGKSKASKGSKTTRQVHGFFHCKRCNIKWQSPNTFIQLRGGQFSFVSQACAKCHKLIEPLKTVALGQKNKKQQSVAKNNRSRPKPRTPRADRSRNGKVYGYYRCSECRRGWESAYTFVKNGRPEYGQQCKSCRSNKHHKAYDWKATQKTCPKCKTLSDLKDKSCRDCGHRFGDEDVHINPLKNHIQALCARCKNRAQPCSSKFW